MSPWILEHLKTPQFNTMNRQIAKTLLLAFHGGAPVSARFLSTLSPPSPLRPPPLHSFRACHEGADEAQGFPCASGLFASVRVYSRLNRPRVYLRTDQWRSG